MVTIHEKNAQTFNTLGLGALLPSRCIVTEELNGAYELELDHPYDSDGKWKRIEDGRIIYASTPRGRQPFRIYRIRPDMQGIKVNARHIFYDLLDNQCSPVSFSGAASDAFSALQAAFAYAMPFSFDTDISISGTLTTGRMNPVQAILSDDDDTTSFVKGFGGELLRDHFNVSMKASMGQDRDVAIRYGKNLIGLEVTQDESDVKTRIQCYGKNGSATLDSPYIGAYLYPKINVLEDENKTVAELQQEAQALLDGGIDIPMVNIKVDFIPLSKTVEYKDYAILEDVQLGDIVTVIHNKMNFYKRARVISYEWDCILEQYNEVELGDFMPTLASSVTSGVRSGSLASNASVTASAVSAALQAHMNDKSNPHQVTAEQTGGSSGGSGGASILYGTEVPDDADGEDGDVYVRMAEYTEYTQVEYIESSGTQYIDTGFVPNQNTRIIVDMDVVTDSSYRGIFGSRNSNNSGFLAFVKPNGDGYQTDYATEQLFTEIQSNVRRIVDKNKTLFTVDGETVATHTTATFSTGYSMFLFAVNKAGTVMSTYMSTAKLYACKIYDNDTLIRDYIPVKDASGVACLYDKVSQTYFYNAGAGAFAAGAELPKEAAGGALYIKINGTWKLAMKGAV